MDFNDVIKSRRSIRKYCTGKSVSKEQIEELIKAAAYAPSWKNSQTARYYCAVDTDAIAKIKNCLPEFNQSNSENAALIVTTFVHNRSGFKPDGEPQNECENGWGYYDLGLANENLLLKATEMGLGTLVMGIRDGEALKTALDIPNEETVVSVIAVGYPNIKPQMPKRKELTDIIKWVK